MSVANNCESNVYYRIKKINFNGPCDIVTLDENGPCALLGSHGPSALLGSHGPSALLGLANVLLLRGSLSFPDTQRTTSSTDLMEQAFPDTQRTTSSTNLLEHIADLLLSAAPAGADSPDLHALQLISALTFLEHLPRGMEADVKFTGVTSFAPTPGLEVFSILGVPLYHAWLPDPANTNVAAMVGDHNSVELIEKIMTYINSDDPFKKIQAQQAEKFLGTAPNQLTRYGVSQLTVSMEEGELGVLFRNRHYVTICKQNGVIYQLVTHEGYLDRDDIVWETLNTIDGVGKFVNHDFESENVITIVDDYFSPENLNTTDNTVVGTVASTETRLAGVGNILGLVDMDHQKRFYVEESIDQSSGFPGRLDCKNAKVCPSGHHLKEVIVSIRLEEQRSGYGGWSCSSCKNDTLGLQGTRFRCDHHKVKNNTTPSVVSLRSGGESRGSMECEFDLCGECFYAKQTKTDTVDNTVENVEYRRHVIENIKELLVEHPHGIFERNFIGIYRDSFGVKIDFQKLGYPSQKSNMSKFLQTLSGSVLEMEYKSDSRLYIKPSKSLLNEIDRSRIESLSLDAIELQEENLPNQSVNNVRKQVQYPPGLKEGTNLDIIVSHVMSPAKFWFQLRGEGTSDALENIMVDMESFYRNNGKNYRLDSGNPRDKCKPGVILAAPYQDNESHDFHRVHVNKICKNNVNKVEVFYLDYGTIEKIPISCLRILHEKFSKLPAQALEGKLWGLAVPSGKKTWPKESARRFLKLVGPVNDAGFGCYSIVKRIQTDASNRVLHLQLIDAVTTKSPAGLCINQQLVLEGLASSVEICEEEESPILPIGADASTALLPVFPHRKAPVIDGNDKIKIIEDDSRKFDVNNNDNVEEAATINNNRVNLIENLYVNLLNHEGNNTLLSSGDISSLMPSWKGRDLLAKMLQMRNNSIDSVDIVQGSDKFEHIINLGLKPTENLENVKMFQLYRVSDVPKLVTMFNKDPQNAKKIIEAIQVAADKVKQDFEASQGEQVVN